MFGCHSNPSPGEGVTFEDLLERKLQLLAEQVGGGEGERRGEGRKGRGGGEEWEEGEEGEGGGREEMREKRG